MYVQTQWSFFFKEAPLGYNEEMAKTVFLSLSLIILFSISCNKPTSSPAGQDNIQTTKAVAEIYPHSAEFKSTGAHGGFYLKDKSTCLQCHGLDLTGGNSQTSCFKCHTHYPHTDSWAVSKNHGAAFLAMPAEKRNECMKCHMPNVANTNQITCNSCHKSFPHVEDFTSIHEAEAQESGASCVGCHTEARNAELSCVGCHEGLVLRPRWKKAPGSEPAADVDKEDKADKKDKKSGHFKKSKLNETSLSSSGSASQKKKK
jgi:hypothetical protein